ncbi:MAG TPA: SUMF1/EgtB/PvdO family nonheme iron enzyme [Rubricoccaceae bacterium]|nr:SUMF1/EgtB/PvdO family nonheme iron enzyme [Rubricoccaceae bacterium]
MRKPAVLLLALIAFGACAPRPVTLAEALGLPPLEMVAVAGGAFEMGDVFEGADEDATPVHAVTVGDFRLGRFEVTAEAFAAFARAAGRTSVEALDGEPLPATGVTWDDAVAFCAAYGYRLPTEAEWEYAAREGGRPIRYAGTSDPDSLRLFAWVADDTASGPYPAGRKRPNALGLYDMSGNVAEWVGAFYQFYPAPGAEPERHDMEALAMRIARGGSIYQEPDFAQTFRRMGTLRDLAASDLGFRCAADAE